MKIGMTGHPTSSKPGHDLGVGSERGRHKMGSTAKAENRTPASCTIVRSRAISSFGESSREAICLNT